MKKLTLSLWKIPMVQTGIIFDDGGDYTNSQDGLFVYLYGLDHILQAGELEIDHGGATGIIRYEVSNVEPHKCSCTGTRKRWQCLQNKFINRW